MRLLRHKSLALHTSSSRNARTADSPAAAQQPQAAPRADSVGRGQADPADASVADFSGEWQMDLGSSDSLAPVLTELGSCRAVFLPPFVYACHMLCTSREGESGPRPKPWALSTKPYTLRPTPGTLYPTP